MSTPPRQPLSRTFVALRNRNYRLFSLFGGVPADRIARRKLMLITQSSMLSSTPIGSLPAVNTGMMICNDRRWPEAWREMGLQSVELVMLGYAIDTNVEAVDVQSRLVELVQGVDLRVERESPARHGVAPHVGEDPRELLLRHALRLADVLLAWADPRIRYD